MLLDQNKMCGLTGFLSFSANGAAEAAHQMADALVHRGPDDAGLWIDHDAGIALAHRRLSILDLSPAGHQPMLSACGRYVIAFNGEIYNHAMIRKELEGLQGCNWRGHSDTETLITAFAEWGVKAALKKCVGMFAFALWDRQARTLTLARDRLGEKPLYYGWQGDTFLFGSELKALKAHPAFQGEVDRDALTLMMRYSYIPAPYSIWRNIYKLPAGCLLTVSLSRHEPSIISYWSANHVFEKGRLEAFNGSPEEAVSTLEKLLLDTVSQQMVADVPLGAFLSGGIDSSAIVALMQAQSRRPMNTFSIGFNEAQFNEAEYAKAVANHLGTDHTELYVTSEDALNVIPGLPTLYDEPFSDASQIPTFLIAQMARQHVTVALSGDAGDELFCGYNRYTCVDRLWDKIALLPIGLRKVLARTLTALSPTAWNRLAWPLMTLLPDRLKQTNLGDKLHKGAGVLDCRAIDELYLGLVSHWKKPGDLVLNSVEPAAQFAALNAQAGLLSGIERMMAGDLITYLPDDILVKVDRAAMGVSLETRVPFLDHRVVEFAWTLPMQYKLRDGVGKWVLREVLYKYVPKSLIERPKMGFGVPIDHWLRGPLRQWAEELLDENRLRQEGFFESSLIKTKWVEHLSGQRNWQYDIWNVLMFQAWLESQN